MSGRQYTSAGKRLSSMTHAKRVHECKCGRVLRGNGGWSSHIRKCIRSRPDLWPGWSVDEDNRTRSERVDTIIAQTVGRAPRP